MKLIALNLWDIHEISNWNALQHERKYWMLPFIRSFVVPLAFVCCDWDVGSLKRCVQMQLCVQLFSLLWCIQVTQYSFCCTEVAKSYPIVWPYICRVSCRVCFVIVSVLDSESLSFTAFLVWAIPINVPCTVLQHSFVFLFKGVELACKAVELRYC